MPYGSNDDLPPTVKKAYSQHQQTVFRSTFNSVFQKYGDEGKAFAIAHAAAKRADENQEYDTNINSLENFVCADDEDGLQSDDDSGTCLLMRTAFASSGGKTKVVRKIMMMVPQHSTYVEPFAGGAALYFHKEPAQKEVLNDLDPDISFMYSFLKNCTDEEVEALRGKYWQSNKELFFRLKDTNEFATNVDRAYRFYYLVAHSFGSNCKTFGYRTLRQVKFYERIPALRQRLANTEVFNTDYAAVVKNYDSPETFFFCLHPDSEVRMADESLKRITEVCAGEQVYSSNPQGSIVTKIMSRPYAGKIYSVKVMGVKDDLKTTPEHPFACIVLSKDDKNHLGRQNSWDRILSKERIEYKRADQLKVGDFAILPIQPAEVSSVKQLPIKKEKIKNGKPKNVPDTIDVVPGLMKLIGYYVAEGHTAGKEGRKYSTVFTFNKNEKGYISEVRSLVKSLFGLDSTEYSRPGATQVIVNSVHFSTFISSLVPGVATTKSLVDTLMLLEPSLQKELLRGWLNGDGGIDCETKRNRNKIVGTTASPQLAHQMYALMLRCGLRPSAKHRENNIDVYLSCNSDVAQFTDDYQLSGKERSKRRILGNYIISPITSITTETYDGFVFNLETTSHDYVADYLLVHNCDPPYPGEWAGPSGSNAWGEKEVDDFVNLLSETQGKWMVTINNLDWIVEKFSKEGFYKYFVPVPRTFNRAHQAQLAYKKELFVTNYPLTDEVRKQVEDVSNINVINSNIIVERYDGMVDVMFCCDSETREKMLSELRSDVMVSGFHVFDRNISNDDGEMFNGFELMKPGQVFTDIGKAVSCLSGSISQKLFDKVYLGKRYCVMKRHGGIELRDENGKEVSKDEVQLFMDEGITKNILAMSNDDFVLDVQLYNRKGIFELMCSDLLYLGRDLRNESLSERKKMLSRLSYFGNVKEQAPLPVSDKEFLLALKMYSTMYGSAGCCVKNRDSKYFSGKSNDWMMYTLENTLADTTSPTVYGGVYDGHVLEPGIIAKRKKRKDG